MLVIEWDDIKDGELIVELDAEADKFPLLQELVAAGECRFTGPISGQLRANPANGMVDISGTVQTTVELSCSRCLQPFSQELTTHFELAFVRELPQVTDEDGDEVELSPEDLGMVLVEHDQIELGDPLAEQLILALPVKALCLEDCRGLCSQCGQDLNLKSCGCKPAAEVLGKFAALKDFKVQKD